MLNDLVAKKVIDCGLSNGADFVDLYVERNEVLSISLKSKKVEQISDGIDFGIGIRVVYGDKALYGYTNSKELEELLRITNYLCVLDKKDPKNALSGFNFLNPKLITKTKSGLDKNISLEEKIKFIRAVDDKSRSGSDLISQVFMSTSERKQTVEIFNSEGLHVNDERFYTRFICNAIATDGTGQADSRYSPGIFGGWELSEIETPEKISNYVVETALTQLKAIPCPGGMKPVIIDKGFGGVIFHEACGHILETTSVEKKASVLWDKMGQMVAHPAVSATDDGTIENGWGSINVDDEGMPTQRTELIKEGKLTSFLVDRMGEIKTGYKRTGSGRKQNYKFAPASRMRNTFIEPGKYKLEELISSVDDGIYAKAMGGGSVNPGTGDFNFAVVEGFLIKNGKIDKPVRGASLIGNGPDVIKKISKVASNFELAAGMCGSVSGAIPASVGQAALMVDEILVGGKV